MTIFVGIDIAKEKLDVSILRETQAQHLVLENSPQGFQTLHHYLHKHYKRETFHLGMEATGLYGDPLAHFLYHKGYPVSVVNPARIKAFAESRLARNKTDKADAQLIALFCQSQQPSLWSPPPPEVQQLRSLLRYLDDLQTMLGMERNRRQSGEANPLVLARLDEHIDFLKQQIHQLLDQIRQHIDHHPDLKQQIELLDSIPGVAELTAWRFLAEIHQWRDFDDAGQVSAYLGLTPRHKQSGKSLRAKTHISKQGKATLRKALYLPAVVAQQYNPVIRAFAERLQQRGLCKLAIITACMRKLAELMYGVLKSGKPFNPHYLSEKIQPAS